MKTGRTLQELYSFPGFRALRTLKGVWGDPQARVITLIRRTKKQFAGAAAKAGGIITTLGLDGFGTWIVGTSAFIWRRTFVAWTVTSVAR